MSDTMIGAVASGTRFVYADDQQEEVVPGY